MVAQGSLKLTIWRLSEIPLAMRPSSLRFSCVSIIATLTTNAARVTKVVHKVHEHGSKQGELKHYAFGWLRLTSKLHLSERMQDTGAGCLMAGDPEIRPERRSGGKIVSLVFVSNWAILI